MRDRKFQFQNFWTECRNFYDCFWTVRAKFRDYFWTVRVEISGLSSDSPRRIFGTFFGQSGTRLRFDCDPETNVFSFCDVFGYHNNLVTNREWTKRCLVLYGSEIWAILCVIVEKNK